MGWKSGTGLGKYQQGLYALQGGGTALVQRCLGAILISCGLIVYMVERRREGREGGREERSKDGVIGKGWERR